MMTYVWKRLLQLRGHPHSIPDPFQKEGLTHVPYSCPNTGPGGLSFPPPFFLYLSPGVGSSFAKFVVSLPFKPGARVQIIDIPITHPEGFRLFFIMPVQMVAMKITQETLA